MNKKQIIETIKTNNVSHIIDLQHLDMIKHKNTLKNNKSLTEPIYDTRLMLCMNEDFIRHINSIVIEKLKERGKTEYYKNVNNMIGSANLLLEEYKDRNEETQDEWSNLLLMLMTEYYLSSFPYNPRELAEKLEMEFDTLLPKDDITLMSFWANKELKQMRINPKSYDKDTLSLENTESEFLGKKGIIDHINSNYSSTDTFCFGLKNKENE